MDDVEALLDDLRLDPTYGCRDVEASAAEEAAQLDDEEDDDNESGDDIGDDLKEEKGRRAEPKTAEAEKADEDGKPEEDEDGAHRPRRSRPQLRRKTTEPSTSAEAVPSSTDARADSRAPKGGPYVHHCLRSCWPMCKTPHFPPPPAPLITHERVCRTGPEHHDSDDAEENDGADIDDLHSLMSMFVGGRSGKKGRRRHDDDEDDDYNAGARSTGRRKQAGKTPAQAKSRSKDDARGADGADGAPVAGPAEDTPEPVEETEQAQKPKKKSRRAAKKAPEVCRAKEDGMVTQGMAAGLGLCLTLCIVIHVCRRMRAHPWHVSPSL